jgi:Xaa-Pro aminopeptidase
VKGSLMKSDFFGGLAPHAEKNSPFVLRRKDLLEAIKTDFSSQDNSIVVMFAGFETEAERFKQDKTFFYYTGLNEPGAALVIAADGKSTLYVPDYFEKRSQWMTVDKALMQKNAKALSVDAVEFLGETCAGYSLDSRFSEREYCFLIARIKEIIDQGGCIYSMAPAQGSAFHNSSTTLDYLARFIPDLPSSLTDISPLVSESRRRKDMSEIEYLYRAVEITELAHESAVQALKEGALEGEIQASLEYIITASDARPSFPSIVATGKNSTILHYQGNSTAVKNGDLLLIDIGAEYNNYCADLTRTYPVSGTFSKRQKEIYQIVLDTQEYIASRAKPGMWIKNKENVEHSLYHLAVKFLAAQGGYDKYFPHGIGHFLGLDVHDVGNYDIPFQEGDVITIEPGIYIPEEGIGIRIEDNYWITKNGAVCLSENLPKEIKDIEKIVQEALDENNKESDEDDEWYGEDDENDEFN